MGIMTWLGRKVLGQGTHTRQSTRRPLEVERLEGRTLLATVFRATFALDGAQEVPAVNTQATGLVSIQVTDTGQIKFKLTVGNIQDVTAAHIHVGDRGVNGGVAATLFAPQTPVDVGAQRTLVRGTLDDGDILAPGGGSVAALLTQLRASNGYVNIHTTGNPTGELRGQIVNNTFASKFALAGDQEVPAVNSLATGAGSISVKNNQIQFKLMVAGIQDVTNAHIHLGAAGANGAVIASLFGPNAGADFPRRGLLARGTLTDAALQGGFTVATLLDELQAGNVYVTVHTLGNPTGEIRGQV